MDRSANRCPLRLYGPGDPTQSLFCNGSGQHDFYSPGSLWRSADGAGSFLAGCVDRWHRCWDGDLLQIQRAAHSGRTDHSRAGGRLASVQRHLCPIRERRSRRRWKSLCWRGSGFDSGCCHFYGDQPLRYFGLAEFHPGHAGGAGGNGAGTGRFPLHSSVPQYNPLSLFYPAAGGVGDGPAPGPGGAGRQPVGAGSSGDWQSQPWRVDRLELAHSLLWADRRVPGKVQPLYESCAALCCSLWCGVGRVVDGKTEFSQSPNHPINFFLPAPSRLDCGCRCPAWQSLLVGGLCQRRLQPRTLLADRQSLGLCQRTPGFNYSLGIVGRSSAQSDPWRGGDGYGQCGSAQYRLVPL